MLEAGFASATIIFAALLLCNILIDNKAQIIEIGILSILPR
jgi:hypothetical protein